MVGSGSVAELLLEKQMEYSGILGWSDLLVAGRTMSEVFQCALGTLLCDDKMRSNMGEGKMDQQDFMPLPVPQANKTLAATIMAVNHLGGWKTRPPGEENVSDSQSLAVKNLSELVDRHGMWKIEDVLTTYWPEDEKDKPVIIDGRVLHDDESAVVVYDNPLDNVGDLAHIFFQRCLEANIVPYVVTKKTVFKWQEGFWQKMKKVFDAEYKDKFLKAGLLDKCGGELIHLISDAATMQIIRWTGGGFGMACHNYDGDMLTDEVAQVHRSPGFITSNLVGKSEDGSLIKEFEASHGTVADLWHMHLRGEETSMNPLGMVVALLGAMDHAAALNPASQAEVTKFTVSCREAVYEAFRTGNGTRDLVGPNGLTTEKFVEWVAKNLEARMAKEGPAEVFTGEEVQVTQAPSKKLRKRYQAVDEDAMKAFFDKFDTDANGTISFDEFVDMTLDLGIAPLKPEELKKEEQRDEVHAEAERL
ncbi:unnamed protein product [Durusdinium trenchii]|uniref:EF-hand domain-containing protein n=1 Tax=Durusdinium trenchii TaxID=1381693 RepID=A0ABP0M181_9DINO